MKYRRLLVQKGPILIPKEYRLFYIVLFAFRLPFSDTNKKFESENYVHLNQLIWIVNKMHRIMTWKQSFSCTNITSNLCPTSHFNTQIFFLCNPCMQYCTIMCYVTQTAMKAWVAFYLTGRKEVLLDGPHIDIDSMFYSFGEKGCIDLVRKKGI